MSIYIDIVKRLSETTPLMGKYEYVSLKSHSHTRMETVNKYNIIIDGDLHTINTIWGTLIVLNELEKQQTISIRKFYVAGKLGVLLVLAYKTNTLIQFHNFVSSFQLYISTLNEIHVGRYKQDQHQIYGNKRWNDLQTNQKVFKNELYRHRKQITRILKQFVITKDIDINVNIVSQLFLQNTKDKQCWLSWYNVHPLLFFNSMKQERNDNAGDIVSMPSIHLSSTIHSFPLISTSKRIGFCKQSYNENAINYDIWNGIEQMMNLHFSLHKCKTKPKWMNSMVSCNSEYTSRDIIRIQILYYVYLFMFSIRV